VKEILLTRPAVDVLDREDLKSFIEGALNRYFAEQMRANPLVQVVLHELAKDGSTRPLPAANSSETRS
jgi:hypothetical protein